MAGFRSAIYLILVAISAPYIYDRYVAFSSMLANRPVAFKPENNFKSYEIKFQDRIRNCEDVILEESLGIAFISCDPGRDRWNTVMGTFHPPSTSKTVTNTGLIWIYAYTNPHLPDSQALKPLTFPNFPHASDFHPLGLSFEAKSSTLYVVNHSRTTGSVVEIFKVSLKSAVAEHIRTFTHPLLHAPNAIHNLGDGKLFISNDHYIRAAVSPFLSKVETFSGIPGGTVVYTDIQNPDATKIVARVPFANGVAMLNASTLAVASSSSYGVYFYELGANHTLGYKAFIRTPAGADNLSVDSEGRLLVAGHPFAPTLMGVAGRRVGCDEEGSEEERAACRCDAPSWVGEWREGEGVRTLLRDGGEGEKGVCSSSTAVRDVKRGVGMVSMLYGRGLVVFKE